MYFNPKDLPTLDEYLQRMALIKMYYDKEMELPDIAAATDLPIMRLIRLFDKYTIYLRPGDREKYSYLKVVK